MLGKLYRFASPEIERLLKKLEADESNYENELRSLDREKLVVPVTVSSFDNDLEVRAFSKNISSGGLCLTTLQPFAVGAEMNVELDLHNLLSKHTAECRWAHKYGKEYWTSGWMIKSEQLNVTEIKEVDTLIQWENRLTERERYDGEPCDIIAECIWSEKYGKNHWMTGWQFPRLDRISKFHSAYFG